MNPTKISTNTRRAIWQRQSLEKIDAVAPVMAKICSESVIIRKTGQYLIFITTPFSRSKTKLRQGLGPVELKQNRGKGAGK